MHTFCTTTKPNLSSSVNASIKFSFNHPWRPVAHTSNSALLRPKVGRPPELQTETLSQKQTKTHTKKMT